MYKIQPRGSVIYKWQTDAPKRKYVHCWHTLKKKLTATISLLFEPDTLTSIFIAFQSFLIHNIDSHELCNIDELLIIFWRVWVIAFFVESFHDTSISHIPSWKIFKTTLWHSQMYDLGRYLLFIIRELNKFINGWICAVQNPTLKH